MNAKTDLVKLLASFPNVSMAKERKTFIDTVGFTKITTKVDLEGNTISFFNGLVDVIVKSDRADGLLYFIDNVIASGWVGVNVIQEIEILKKEIEDLDYQKWWEQFGVAVDKPIITGCPYRDLFPFREEDSKLFFGRQAWNEQLLNKVKSQSFVGVIGASGSGKSSLVFAGLIPQLRQEQNWQIVSFRPLFDPWVSLAMAFVSVLEPELSEIEREREIQEYTKLLKQSGKIRYFVGRILEKNHGDRLLLFIDQFEEFYRSGLDKKEREEFLDELFLALEPNPLEISSNCSIAITLRADFLGYALDTPHIGDELQRDDLKLTRMNPQELRDAIEKPAQLAGAWLEKGLTERILDAVEEKSGSLPLLQFALTQLWHQREDNQLTHAAYDRIGGLKKALPNYAEDIYGKLKSEQQKVKMVFLQLVHPRPEPEMEDTRRLATRDEVGEDNWDLAIRLASERLVVTGRDSATGEDTLEVVHEVLIQEWQRFKQWIEEERQYIVLRLDIEARAKKWRDRDRGKDYVLKGKELKEAKKFQKEQGASFPLSELAVLFIQASVKQGWLGSFEIITRVIAIATLGFGIVYPYVQNRQTQNAKQIIASPNAGGKVEALQYLTEGCSSQTRQKIENDRLASLLFGNCEDFSGVNLTGAEVSGAKLTRAKFIRATLSGAKFIDSDLSEANLSQAKLIGVALTKANLTKTNLTGAIFSLANLNEANFSRADLSRAKFNGISFIGVNLTQANLEGADFRKYKLFGGKSLTPEQVKAACNWQKATFDDEFWVELESSPPPDRQVDCSIWKNIQS